MSNSEQQQHDQDKQHEQNKQHELAFCIANTTTFNKSKKCKDYTQCKTKQANTQISKCIHVL